MDQWIGLFTEGYVDAHYHQNFDLFLKGQRNDNFFNQVNLQ